MDGWSGNGPSSARRLAPWPRSVAAGLAIAAPVTVWLAVVLVIVAEVGAGERSARGRDRGRGSWGERRLTIAEGGYPRTMALPRGTGPAVSLVAIAAFQVLFGFVVAYCTGAAAVARGRDAEPGRGHGSERGTVRGRSRVPLLPVGGRADDPCHGPPARRRRRRLAAPADRCPGCRRPTGNGRTHADRTGTRSRGRPRVRAGTRGPHARQRVDPPRRRRGARRVVAGPEPDRDPPRPRAGHGPEAGPHPDPHLDGPVPATGASRGAHHRRSPDRRRGRRPRYRSVRGLVRGASPPDLSRRQRGGQHVPRRARPRRHRYPAPDRRRPGRPGRAPAG